METRSSLLPARTAARAAFAFLAVVTAGAASLPAEGRAAPPLRVVDRMKVVGAPVLDETTAEGVYVWIEDGTVRVAAVPKAASGAQKPRRRTFAVRVESNQTITAVSGGDFEIRGAGSGSVNLAAKLTSAPAQVTLRTQGEVVVAAASADGKGVPIFVGPLASRAVPGVRIGRF